MVDAALAAQDAAVVQSHLLGGLRIAAATIAVVVLSGLALPAQLVAAHHHPVSVGGLTALLSLSIVGVALAATDRSWGRWRAPVAVAALLIATVDALMLPAEALISAEQQITGAVGWVWVMLFIDVGMRPLVGMIGAHVAITLALLAPVGRFDAPTVVHFLLVAIAFVGYQLALGAAAGALRAVARNAAAVAAHESELRSAAAIARRLHADRKQRYAALRATALPLLRGLANGSACPADAGVQRRAAREAARLRRMFVEADDVPDPLRAELAAVLDVAERRGLLVQQAVLGRGPTPPLEVRRLLLDELAAVLVRARGSVRVTVAGRPDGVTVSVVARTHPPPADDVAPGRRQVGPVALATVVEGGQVWTQASWNTTSRS